MNQQLRQHEIDLRKEKQKKAAEKMDTTQTKESKLTQDSMKTMISADSALKQADVYEKVATQKEGQSNVLKTEIKLDESRGGNAEKKKEELTKLQQEVREQQASTLADAIETKESDKDISVSETTKASDSIQTDNGKNEQANETQAGYQHIDVVVDNNTPAVKNEEDESEIDTYI